MIWATGWEERANDHLPHLLGLRGRPPRAHLWRPRPLRHRPLEARSARGVRAATGRWPGSTTPSTRAVTRGRPSEAPRPCSCPTESDVGLTDAQVDAILDWAASWITNLRGLTRRPASSRAPAPSDDEGYRSLRVDGRGLPIFFLMVVLKIPVGLCSTSSGGRSERRPSPRRRPRRAHEEHRFGRFRRQPARPRGPRRGGPHPRRAAASGRRPRARRALHRHAPRATAASAPRRLAPSPELVLAI